MSVREINKKLNRVWPILFGVQCNFCKRKFRREYLWKFLYRTGYCHNPKGRYVGSEGLHFHFCSKCFPSEPTSRQCIEKVMGKAPNSRIKSKNE